MSIAFAHIARHEAKAVVCGKVRVLGIEHGGVAKSPLEHGRFEIVDHHLVGNGAKVGKGMLVAGEEMFHGLRDGELDIHHAAVA